MLALNYSFYFSCPESPGVWLDLIGTVVLQVINYSMPSCPSLCSLESCHMMKNMFFYHNDCLQDIDDYARQKKNQINPQTNRLKL